MMEGNQKERPMTNDFHKGFICAVAEIVRLYDKPTIAAEVLKSNFMTVDKMRRIGIEEYDIKSVAPLVTDILRKRKVNRMGKENAGGKR